jgi:hypothetical protein
MANYDDELRSRGRNYGAPPAKVSPSRVFFVAPTSYSSQRSSSSCSSSCSSSSPGWSTTNYDDELRSRGRNYGAPPAKVSLSRVFFVAPTSYSSQRSSSSSSCSSSSPGWSTTNYDDELRLGGRSYGLRPLKFHRREFSS